jgi:hypothetical protein
MHAADLQLDFEKYLPQLAHFSMSEQRKRVLLRVLWRAMRSFAERGYGLEPSCDALPTAAKTRQRAESDGATAG